MKHCTGAHAGFAICLASLMLFFSSCSKNDKDVSGLSPTPDVKEMTNYLVSRGFDGQRIVFDKDRVVIENDIVMTTSDLEQRVATWKREMQSGVPQTEQRRGTYIVSNAYNTNIKFYIDPAVPDNWRDAIQGAVDNWNAVNGTRLGMSIVNNQASANTQVFMGYEDASWIARAYLPEQNSRPGVTVEINGRYNDLDPSEKLFAITHEFGHTIGFLHTDQGGTLIPGTPSVDPNSVMNSFVLPWNGFTNGDIRATQVLYPQ
ncbi:MAG TPA: M57 family metalloprotease [Chitinophaga sp.]|uniref:M57 family metalloprotease n=1 Tax=Chitinophaga sp. TaxID=1869181 RepID=UPI002BAB2A0F|nr:M57 family metalloprotease [Chitinophaga sp.]HVI47435.1 M57 family metalloprotease [Chitinophaga sp.]